MRRNFTHFSIFLLLLTLTSSAAFGQAPAKPNMTNEDFRKQAPAPLPPRPINLPKPVESTLSNGLKVVIVADKRAELHWMQHCDDAKNDVSRWSARVHWVRISTGEAS